MRHTGKYLIVSILLGALAMPSWALTPILHFTSEGQKFRLESVFKTKDVIWAFKFLPDGKIIFNERRGAIKIFDPASQKISEVSGAPTVEAIGQGGLMDLALDPNFPTNHFIYLTYTLKENHKTTTALSRSRLDGHKLNESKILFKAQPFLDTTIQFGSRIVFDGRGFMFVSLGDRDVRELAQKLDNDWGKVIRLQDNGSVPKDNPFIHTSGALAEIWTLGHRNPEGLAWSADRQQLWESEHGPRGGDEINLIEPGKNYGWPVITYGREYSGPPIGEGTSKEGMEQPIKYYVPSIAPSSLNFYTGHKISPWTGNIFVGALVLQHLNRLVLSGNKIVKEERLLRDWHQRIRDVHTGPDEALYVSTDEGHLARIVADQ
jgi:glucose/arabinose dehydrogenase